MAYKCKWVLWSVCEMKFLPSFVFQKTEVLMLHRFILVIFEVKVAQNSFQLLDFDGSL